MVQRRRLASVLVGLALVALTACSGGSGRDDAAPTGTTPATDAPSASPSPSPTPGGTVDRYVALGDSYTSGPFVPRVRLDPVGCARSASNYPAFVAELLRVRTYVDVSCAGAETADLSRRQQIALGTNVVQLDAVDERADLVTVGIGGNDFDVFSRLTGTCPRVRSQDPDGSPCRDAFADSGSSVEDVMARVGRRVQRVLAEVARRAPDARVVVVGYPRIVPADGTCTALPFARGDYGWADRVERSLNAAVAGAARRAGATFVDTYGPSRGHDACAGDDAWVSGADFDPEVALAYHPREAGMRATAEEVVRALTGRDETAGEPFDSGAPTMTAKEQRDLARRLTGATGG